MILAVFRISPAHQAGAVKCSVAGTKSVPGSQHGRGGWQGFLNSPEGTWPLLVSAQEVRQSAAGGVCSYPFCSLALEACGPFVLKSTA